MTRISYNQCSYSTVYGDWQAVTVTIYHAKIRKSNHWKEIEKGWVSVVTKRGELLYLKVGLPSLPSLFVTFWGKIALSLVDFKVSSSYKKTPGPHQPVHYIFRSKIWINSWSMMENWVRSFRRNHCTRVASNLYVKFLAFCIYLTISSRPTPGELIRMIINAEWHLYQDIQYYNLVPAVPVWSKETHSHLILFSSGQVQVMSGQVKKMASWRFMFINYQKYHYDLAPSWSFCHLVPLIFTRQKGRARKRFEEAVVGWYIWPLTYCTVRSILVSPWRVEKMLGVYMFLRPYR